MSERHTATYVMDPPGGARPRHYLVAMLLVAVALAGAVRALDRPAASDAASETQDAMLIDLPPVEAGSHPQGDNAPTQQAAPVAADAVTPPKPEDKADPPKPAVVEIAKPPPPQQPAPTSAPQSAHEAGGPQKTHAADTDADDAESRRASSHLITLWQKALMARLQATRHRLPHHQHYFGLAEVAFAINHDGGLVFEHIAQSSGSSALDAAALSLVRLAAPYPAPPHDAGGTQLSFVVPIDFKP